MAEGFLNTLKNTVQNFFQGGDESSEEVIQLRQIVDQLDHLPQEQAHYLASFAFILFRVAYADSKLSKEEANEIENILQKWSHLTETQAILVAQLAKQHNLLFGGTDNFLVTREFKDMATEEQKVDLLNCLFAVAASDDSISSVENDTIRKISRELGMEHDEFILSRQSFLDKLEALK